MIEGFSRLVQVRRRQDNGVAEIEASFPELLVNQDVTPAARPLWRRALADPVAFAVFSAVRAAVYLPLQRNADRWARGR
jgi:hypothetical protein